MSERFRVAVTGLGSPDLTFEVCALEGEYKAAAIASLTYMDRFSGGHILRESVGPLGRGDPSPEDLVDRTEW